MTEKLAIAGGTPVRSGEYGPQHIFGEEDVEAMLDRALAMSRSMADEIEEATRHVTEAAAHQATEAAGDSLCALAKASASYQFTVATGQSPQVFWKDGLLPINASHSACVTSVDFSENDRVSVTSCCSSSS